MSNQYSAEFYIKNYADLLADHGLDILLSSIAHDQIEDPEFVPVEKLDPGEAIIEVQITFTDVTKEFTEDPD